MERNNDNSFIYALKFIACLFVITIHAPFPGVFGDIVYSLSRFAVPFFFAVSGRYLLVKRDGSYAQNAQEIRSYTLGRLIKLLKITGVVYLTYLIFSLCYFIPKGWTFKYWLHDKFNLFETRTFFLFNSGRYIYDESYVFDHLWYLFALIYVFVLIIIFASVLRKWYKWLTVVLLGMMFFGELLQTVYPIRPFDISINTWYILRNWLFMGMPFVLIGVIFADKTHDKREGMGEERYKETMKALLPRNMILLSLGCIISIAEVFIFQRKEVYIGSVIIVFSLLLLSECGLNAGSILPDLGKRASSLIYFYHVMIISVLDILSQNGIIPSYTMWQKPLIVMVISVLLFAVIPYFIDKVKVNEQK
ncbi:acyltransferase family protein [Butyrivibrio sp. XPD2006]|uniref:acyltransferase family protein n=1 Tax=Butyrivibrio sp. XPD2006 TaxID=1280668 RepID=UPI0003B5AFE9|nr:acyltransferase family protein [Butyrivibrio sp. XPD2006]